MFGPAPLGPDAPPLDRLVASGRARLRFAHTHHQLLAAANRDPQSHYGAAAMLSRAHVRILLAWPAPPVTWISKPMPYWRCWRRTTSNAS